jgi:hypothetical protein
LLRGIESEKSKKEKMGKKQLRKSCTNIIIRQESAIKKGKHEENIGYGIQKKYRSIYIYIYMCVCVCVETIVSYRNAK